MEPKFIEELREAFIWEGNATSSIVLNNDEKIIIKLASSSICEHSGDENGIITQIQKLMNKSFTEEGIKYTIINTEYSQKRGEYIRDEDDESDDCDDCDTDYYVYTYGTVTLKKEKV